MNHPQDENELFAMLGIPLWIESFMENGFSSKCSLHSSSKNDVVMNRFCTLCNAFGCKRCIESGDHHQHRVLTIHSHGYQQVVALDQMEYHMDCSRIQTHKCNKKLVIALTPLLQNGSCSNIENDYGACVICKTMFANPNDRRFVYCSIACKLSVVLRVVHMNKLRREMLALAAKAPAVKQASTSQAGRKRNRKGVPERAFRKV